MRKVNVGLCGCGGFMRNIHIPILKENPKYAIHAIMDINEETAKSVAEDTGAKYSTTKFEDLLNDDEIDAVFIGTRHDLHAELTIRAANAGKHVMCEKPMGLNRRECKDICEAVKKNNIKYTVGYNRGMAPMIAKARDFLKDDDHKKMIYHRIQGPFPVTHWIHDPVIGGGRFVGEGCHIFDLLCEIVDKPPVKVYAAGSIFLDPDKVKIPDSAIVTITFEDGSIGTTLINSAGNPTLSKEVTEIYCNGKGIYIDNFKDMQYCGFEGQKSIELNYEKGDKGHAMELDMFAAAILNDTDSPNGLMKASRAAVISYMVSESIKAEKPVNIAPEDYIF